MQPRLFFQQLIFRFGAVGIGDAAIYGANCSTLWLFVEAHAFRAFIGYYIVVIIFNGLMPLGSIGITAVLKGIGAGYGVAVGYGPLHTALINGVVRAFGLTGSAVNTFVSDNYGHGKWMVICGKQVNLLLGLAVLWIAKIQRELQKLKLPPLLS